MDQNLMALTGGLAGALFTQTVNAIVYCLTGPKLRITFDPGERGCIVSSPARQATDRGDVDGNQRIVRMLVENKGLKTAHQVCLSATEIEFRPETGSTVFAEEVLEFLLALSDRSVFDIPSGGRRFVDVFFC